MKIIFCKDEAEVGEVAGKIIVDLVKSKPDGVLGLATGSTPVKTYKYMIDDHKTNNTKYENIKTYNLDEYIGLNGEHDQSYRYFMNENLFNHIDIKKENTNVPVGIGDPDENRKAYDKVLDQLGGADIQVLGIGSNGHIAFNEPGTPFELTTTIVDLTEKTIDDNARFFDNKEDVPKKAITMGIKSILNAKKIILLATGEGKQEAIKNLFTAEISPMIPATALRNHEDVVVIVDEKAGKLVKDME